MKTFVILLFVCLTIIATAQLSVDLRPQVRSPEITKFEDYSNIPVNLTTGIPEINIPIYTISYGGITLPITLRYEASGLKIEEVASCVGLKWSLDVGGAVSRIIKGSPDEGNPFVYPFPNINIKGYYIDYGLTKLNSELNKFEPNDPSLPRYGAFNMFIVDVASGKLDTQPDLFSFTVPEGSGKFVFDENRNIVFLENTDFTVKEHSKSGQKVFDKWEITSPNGIKYFLGNNKDGSSSTVEESVSSSMGELTNNYITDAWFLKTIENTVNGKMIQID